MPSKDSALGRALRVLGYNLLIVLLAFANDPTVVKAFIEYYPQTATIVGLGAPVVAFLYNYFRKDVPNY